MVNALDASACSGSGVSAVGTLGLFSPSTFVNPELIKKKAFEYKVLRPEISKKLVYSGNNPVPYLVISEILNKNVGIGSIDVNETSGEINITWVKRDDPTTELTLAEKEEVKEVLRINSERYGLSITDVIYAFLTVFPLQDNCNFDTSDYPSSDMNDLKTVCIDQPGSLCKWENNTCKPLEYTELLVCKEDNERYTMPLSCSSDQLNSEEECVKQYGCSWNNGSCERNNNFSCSNYSETDCNNSFSCSWVDGKCEDNYKIYKSYYIPIKNISDNGDVTLCTDDEVTNDTCPGASNFQVCKYFWNRNTSQECSRFLTTNLTPINNTLKSTTGTSNKVMNWLDSIARVKTDTFIVILIGAVLLCIGLGMFIYNKSKSINRTSYSKRSFEYSVEPTAPPLPSTSNISFYPASSGRKGEDEWGF